MTNLSIKNKFFGIFYLLFLVIFSSGMVILHSLSNAREDTEIMNVLGRQTMLSHQMAQSVFGFIMAKSQEKTMVQQIKSLDDYITQMRKIYTESVIDQVDKVGMAISIDPSSESHPTVPFPATFTRMVNEKFGDTMGLTVSIISEDPINSNQNLKSELDREANAFLKKSPNETFSKIFEENGKLYIGLYSPDKATASACISCHSAFQSKNLKLGDILGIRRYKLVYSEDIALGREELNATLNQYIIAHTTFQQTISAIKSGGQLPLDLSGTLWKEIPAVSDLKVQSKIVEIDMKFSDLEQTVNTLLNLETNSLPYRKARRKIISESTKLRNLSLELVVLYEIVAKRNQKNIKFAVVTAGAFTLLMLICLALYLARVVVKPIQIISKVLTETVKGNLKQKELIVNSKDEIGILNQSCNELTGGLQRFIHYSEDIHFGKFKTDSFDLEGDFKTSLEKIKSTAIAKRRAEQALREAQVGLESRVKERTSELLQSNETLKEEISRREKSDQALQRVMNQNKLILESAGEGIYGLDLDGKTTFVNPAAAKMLGHSFEELIGITQHSLIHNSNPDGNPYSREDNPIYAVFETGKIQNEVNEVFWRKNGSSFPVEYISTPIKEDGKIIGAVVTFKDITERKLLQTQLNHAQKMESIGHLAAGISHEINTPMQFIGDNTRFLEDSFRQLFGSLNAHDRLRKECKSGTVSQKVVEEVEDSLKNNEIDYLSEEVPLAIKQTLEGVQRVTHIVRAMKEFSHPGSEEKIPTDINQAIESTLTVAKNEWKYIAEIVRDFDSNLPLIPCLVNDFNQVILNTVVNAAHAIENVVKNSGDKGTITISTRKDEDWAEIRIKDTGSGIPKDIRSKIFDPFFTTKEIGKGTGQGLSIIHSIMVNKHNGTIDLESEEGKGTTFIFRFPISSNGIGEDYE